MNDNNGFAEYKKNHFKVDDSGNVCHVRQDCFNGNGLLEPITLTHLENLLDHLEEKHKKELEQKDKEITELKSNNNTQAAMLRGQQAMNKENQKLAAHIELLTKCECEKDKELFKKYGYRKLEAVHKCQGCKSKAKIKKSDLIKEVSEADPELMKKLAEAENKEKPKGVQDERAEETVMERSQEEAPGKERS
ncbi:MAG: hypothetical protein Unbinned1322contig1000_25 [Prokaryotic dsDNA virus sp.]|nr:MAG: hypothetical protein Unbinned1322contig1000_25 [Prokaryotic dsDNA virus sp.]|tara:strand:+ start:8976 stop:9551 length:576 start_codon:yes stop_codon:yes gene_type:complete